MNITNVSDKLNILMKTGSIVSVLVVGGFIANQGYNTFNNMNEGVERMVKETERMKKSLDSMHSVIADSIAQSHTEDSFREVNASLVFPVRVPFPEIQGTFNKWIEQGWGAQISSLQNICEKSFDKATKLYGYDTMMTTCGEIAYRL